MTAVCGEAWARKEVPDDRERRFLIVVQHAVTVLWAHGLGDRLLHCLFELPGEVDGEAVMSSGSSTPREASVEPS